MATPFPHDRRFGGDAGVCVRNLLCSRAAAWTDAASGIEFRAAIVSVACAWTGKAVIQVVNTIAAATTSRCEPIIHISLPPDSQCASHDAIGSGFGAPRLQTLKTAVLNSLTSAGGTQETCPLLHLSRVSA
jgi:hypothetical protein